MPKRRDKIKSEKRKWYIANRDKILGEKKKYYSEVKCVVRRQNDSAEKCASRSFHVLCKKIQQEYEVQEGRSIEKIAVLNVKLVDDTMTRVNVIYEIQW